MARRIVSIPRELMKAVTTNWRIRWGGQSAGSDTAGGDQTVVSAFPRWVGSPKVIMGSREIRAWSAMLDMARGREALFRVPMIERLKSPFDTTEMPFNGNTPLTSADMSNRPDLEARPTVRCAVAAVPGQSSIIVDETQLVAQIPVGWILSYDDRPFRVLWRAPSAGGLTEIGVTFVRSAIPLNAAIDLFATGLFIAVADEGSFPEIGGESALVDMDFEEYITR